MTLFLYTFTQIMSFISYQDHSETQILEERNAFEKQTFRKCGIFIGNLLNGNINMIYNFK